MKAFLGLLLIPFVLVGIVTGFGWIGVTAGWHITNKYFEALDKTE